MASHSPFHRRLRNPLRRRSDHEQRRFRRLEVSLPVWVGREGDVRASSLAPGERAPWSLGYTRDISMGGAKIIVPPGEERKWLAAVQRSFGWEGS